MKNQNPKNRKRFWKKIKDPEPEKIEEPEEIIEEIQPLEPEKFEEPEKLTEEIEPPEEIIEEFKNLK